MGFDRAGLLLAAGLIAATAALCALPASADDRQDAKQRDAGFARRVFAGGLPDPKAFACFARHYDAAHLAQHPLQKVSVAADGPGMTKGETHAAP